MFENVLLFIHLKMVKIGCMLNIIYSNKACCSVWHGTTTVHLVILMGITSCKISWVFAVNCMISSTVMWACCNVYVQHIVTNHTESQISQERRAALPSPFTGGWLHMCSFKKKKKKMHYSLTFCQLYFLVPLSSFLAHLLARLTVCVSVCVWLNSLCIHTCVCVAQLTESCV